MEGINAIKEFLSVMSGDGSGHGSGDGYGSGSGYGDGSGYGPGYSSGSGSGSGYGYGDGYGDGSGYGSGYGYGDGSGYGSGYGSGVKTIFNHPVYIIDGVYTLIYAIKKGFARGAILNDDLTLTPCYVAKGGDKFAHGETIKKAVTALQDKLFEDMPEEERISAFLEAHNDPKKKYAAKDLWVWHNRLTGSCEMGRNRFVRDHGYDIDHDEFSVQEFVEIVKDHYGSSTIKKMWERYKEEVRI